MMARRGLLGLIAGGGVLLLAGCGLFGGNSYRFRMTVEVETPEGLRTGSSVYAVKAIGSQDLVTRSKGSRTELRGEAVAVDLPDGRTVFALLKTVNPLRDDLAAMSMVALDPAYAADRMASAQRIARGDGIRSPAEVAPADYPLLVTFRDLDDPRSVERVDPANLAARFGPGVRLKRITVETTDDDVTSGIEKRLGWLQHEGRTLDPEAGPTISPTFAQIVRQSDFSTEIGR